MLVHLGRRGPCPNFTLPAACPAFLPATRPEGGTARPLPPPESRGRPLGKTRIGWLCLLLALRRHLLSGSLQSTPPVPRGSTSLCQGHFPAKECIRPIVKYLLSTITQSLLQLWTPVHPSLMVRQLFQGAVAKPVPLHQFMYLPPIACMHAVGDYACNFLCSSPFYPLLVLGDSDAGEGVCGSPLLSPPEPSRAPTPETSPSSDSCLLAGADPHKPLSPLS